MKKIKSIKVINSGSMCDIDTDFHTVGRNETLQYVITKYGKDNVAGIMTPTMFKGRNTFKTVSTLFGVPATLQNSITETMPESVENIPLLDLVDSKSKNYDKGVEFRKMISDDTLMNVVKNALPLEGRLRGTGVHACGIVISTKPITQTVPVHYVDKVNMAVTEWNYYTDEALGLIKMDFLGLDTVDIVQSTIKTIKEKKGIEINVDEIIQGDLNDEKTLDLFRKGHTTGIFQFTGQGVKEMLLSVQPDNFNDLPAITALYRPGPMSMNAHIDYATRKQDPKLRIPVDESFIGTDVDRILKETLGLLVYQEQIMNISKACAGFTAREADNLRKGIGKKNIDLIKSMGEQFISGMVERGYNKNAVEKLWDGIVGFGAYSFNKSHSVAYALTSYLSAYLKAHYPVEFMASLIKQRLGDPDKLNECLTELKRMGIVMQPASVNESEVSVTSSTQGNSVIFGLEGIKGLQKTIGYAIVDERIKNGLFNDIDDFMRRMVKRGELTASAIKCLANIGAFDCFNVSRKSVADNANKFIKAIEEEKAKSNQTSLFALSGIEVSNDLVVLDEEDYPYHIQAKFEGDLTNQFLSKHPLDKIHQREFDLTEPNLNVEDVYVVFSDISIKSKKGRKYGFVLTDNKFSRRELTLGEDILLSLDKYKALKTSNNISDFYKKMGIDENDSQAVDRVNNIPQLEKIETNAVYKVSISTPIFNRNGKETYGRSTVKTIKQVPLSFDGRLIIPILVKDIKLKDKYVKKLKANKGDSVIRLYFPDKTYEEVSDVLFLPGTTQQELSTIR